jgi:uncharacterized membrane protein
MEGVKKVTKIHDQRLRWKAAIVGKTQEWDAEIFEQFPDQRIARPRTCGATNSGSVDFTALGAEENNVGPLMEFHGRNVSKLLRDVGDWA